MNTTMRTPPKTPGAGPVQRLSTAHARRRLSSAAVVVSSGNTKDAILEATRQRFEDKKRRISIVSPKTLRPQESKQEMPSNKPSFDLLSHDDATEHYRQCLRLAIENKINKKNAFDLKLIENLGTILSGKNRQNFALCASLVDVGTRIFGSRVDANDIELKRICTWLCGGTNSKKDLDENEDNNDKSDKINGADYGGNDSVLAEMKSEEKKKRSHSKKAVIEEDNHKLTAVFEKRSKSNPLMRGRRSALAAGGISEGLASVLLMPSLSVIESPLNEHRTTLNYVVSDDSNKQFSSWIRRHSDKVPSESNEKVESKPRWPLQDLENLDLSKSICPPLQSLDLNKTFGEELDSINSTAGIDISCEEALHSKTHLNLDDDENVGVISLPKNEMNEDLGDDDSFEMPALEDQSMNQEDVTEQQDCMLLMPMEDTTAMGCQTTSAALPLATGATFSIDQLHDVLAKTLANGNGQTDDNGGERIGVAPAWLLEQLVNGTVGKALKMKSRTNTTEDKPAAVVKPRRNVVKVQKISFSDDLHQAAESKLSQKFLPKSSKKPNLSSSSGDYDLPDPVINHEFDQLLSKFRDCFIAGGARTVAAPTPTTEIGRQVSLNDDDDDADGQGHDYDNEHGIDLEEPFFSGENLEASIHPILSRHHSVMPHVNGNEEEEDGQAIENNGGSSSAAIPQLLLEQVRNAANSLVASLTTRKVDVRIAKTELLRSVEQHAPETNMSTVMSTANERLAESSKQREAENPGNKNAKPSAKLSPQMAFVCLLHLANEHDLALKTSLNFQDIAVQASRGITDSSTSTLA